MSTWFRHGDPRFPFLWESAPQAAARWHDAPDAPASYYADTPDGAWAEFLRHEGIVDAADLAGVARRLWAVAVADDVVTDASAPALDELVLLGGLATYRACQSEARRLRAAGAVAVLAPSAALLPGAARGQMSTEGLQEAGDRDGRVLVLFGGRWPEVRGWATVAAGAPTERILELVRPLG